jgi:DNA-binding transcriptional MerR regulator
MLYSRIVPEPVVEIPNRPAFRASEVCEIAQIPPYVLKSWEKEFPGLGVTARPGGPRVYRRADVEQVVRIKHLLFAEGLTLAGARRRIEGEPKPEEEPLPNLAVPGEVREKVSRIKQELRGLLSLLSAPPSATRVGEQATSSDAHDAEPPASAPPVEDAAAPAGRVEDAAVPAPPVEDAAAPAGRVEDAAAPAPPVDLPLLDGVTEDPNPPEPTRSRRGGRRKP